MQISGLPIRKLRDRYRGDLAVAKAGQVGAFKAAEVRIAATFSIASVHNGVKMEAESVLSGNYGANLKYQRFLFSDLGTDEACQQAMGALHKQLREKARIEAINWGGIQYNGPLRSCRVAALALRVRRFKEHLASRKEAA